MFRLSAALRVQIIQQEARKQQGRRIEDMSVEDLLNAARAGYAIPTRQSWEQTVPYLERALILDPDNWMATAMLGTR